MNDRINRKILFKNKSGEYEPYDKTDVLLIRWCTLYNKKVRFGKMLPYTESPIQTNLLYYVTPYKRDRLLSKWCEEHNKELIYNRRGKNFKREESK